MSLTPKWYKEWFGRDYLSVYSHRDTTDARKQAELIRTFISPPGKQLLDLACGDGRHCRIFDSMGFTVTGLDLSDELIATAKKNSPDTITYIISDMRDIRLNRRFDIITNLFTSFGYFENDRENLAVIEEAVSNLTPGGLFWIDFLNEKQVKAGLRPVTSKILDNGFEVTEERSLSPDEKRIEKTITIHDSSDTRTYRESVRLYTPEELTGFFHSCGLRVMDMLGDYDGSAFNKDSPRLIIPGEKV